MLIARQFVGLDFVDSSMTKRRDFLKGLPFHVWFLLGF